MCYQPHITEVDNQDLSNTTLTLEHRIKEEATSRLETKEEGSHIDHHSSISDITISAYASDHMLQMWETHISV